MTKVTEQMTKKKEFKKVIVEGIAMYAAVHAPKKAFTEGEPPLYSLDLIVDDTNAQILLNEGLKPAKTIIDEDTKKLKEYKEKQSEINSELQDMPYGAY